jgi:uncharacterized membrane protein
VSEAVKELSYKPSPGAIGKAIPRWVGRLALFVTGRWLFLANSLAFTLIALPVLAPWLMALGATLPARVIYFCYRFLCHQMPSRSYFVFGHQLAICQRDLAIYASILLAGLLFGLVRNRIEPLRWWLYLLLVTPMAIDSLSQFLGWRESNWQWRTLAGGLFGVANVALVYPFLERGMQEARASLIREQGGYDGNGTRSKARA